MFIFFTINANAADLFVISDEENNPEDIEIMVLDYNEFHDGEYIVGDIDLETYISLYDKQDKLLLSQLQGIGETILPFYKDTAKIVIYQSEELKNEIISLEINFCDNDNVCEPCNSVNCNNAENYLTCNDCSSGSQDGFCDLKKDNVCDPDCDGIESDCEDCEPFCLFEDMTCSAMKGTSCDENEFCNEGYFVEGLFEDGELIFNCCIEGTCSSEEQLTEIKETQEKEPEPLKTEPSEPVGPEEEFDSEFYTDFEPVFEDESQIKWWEILLIILLLLIVFFIIFILVRLFKKSQPDFD